MQADGRTRLETRRSCLSRTPGGANLALRSPPTPALWGARGDPHTEAVQQAYAGIVTTVLADPQPPPRVALPEQLVLARDRYGR